MSAVEGYASDRHRANMYFPYIPVNTPAFFPDAALQVD